MEEGVSVPALGGSDGFASGLGMFILANLGVFA